MGNEVSNFLKGFAVSRGYQVYQDQFGEVFFADSPELVGGETRIELSSGAVYGFFAIKEVAGSELELFSEVGRCSGSIDEKIGMYPLYWGKDIYPGSRIAAHVRPRSATGNAELEKISSLRRFRVIYGSIYVSRYQDFERELHKEYPPLIGTAAGGKKLGYTSIIF